jgi:hypothetical protein
MDQQVKEKKKFKLNPFFLLTISILILVLIPCLLAFIVLISPVLLLGYLGTEFFNLIKTLRKQNLQFRLKKLQHDNRNIFTRYTAD